MSREKISDDFLKMFDALMVIETPGDAREIAQNPDLIEDLEFHESAGDEPASTVDDAVPNAADELESQ